MLSEKQFADLVRNGPIIAVDFIIENSAGQIVLGKRLNNPAKGFYFTFGGAILKNEKITDSIERVSLNELNFKLKRNSLTMINVFEVFSPHNFLNNSEFTTHYILLSYHYKDLQDNIVPLSSHESCGTYFNQHSDFLWLHPIDLIKSPAVHNDCKAIIKYFYEKKAFSEGKYA